ncbi:MAG: ABC transporter ATP-binding protein [Actinobacteria bacterium]|nr:ABC transporter ATP-binding protein [Actinomycetota bacterium]
MMSNASSISLRHVSKQFGDVVAVADISLDIADGEFLTLLGPSGSGKTTVLRMIAGFELPTSGEILLNGSDVSNEPAFKRDVNTVFQHYALFPHMTVAENVAYGLRQKGVAKSEIATRVTEALDMVQMTKLAERRPRQMSGGQQQRVAVARALVNRPSILLLDEPLGALDRKLREEMQIELKLLQTRLGITFVFVTHDQEEAMSMSDRIAIMLNGHIEQIADPETVYEHPTTAFVAGFVGRNNFWQGTATEHGSQADDGTIFVASRPEEDVPNGEPALSAVRPECINLSAKQPTKPENSTQATVAGVSYFGDVLQYVVRTRTKDLLVLVPRTNPERFQVDDPVWCSWSAEDVYLFSARQANIVLAAPAATA